MVGDQVVQADTALDHAALRSLPPADVRAAIRAGHYARHTAGLADGRLQCNVAILPEAFAVDFLRYCQRNPKPCPLVGVSDTGDPIMRTLGSDIDIRSDLPSYNVYRDGRLDDKTSDIRELWRSDFVAFAIGCSFTFERALAAAGIVMRHVQHDTTVPMFRTSLQTIEAGPFGGGMVVSMRPIPDAELDRVTRICRRYPLAHGAPIHAGDPAGIGIAALECPDWGEPTPLGPQESPVFWACGVTPQNAILRARLPICITHTPGCMLITDVADDSETPIICNDTKHRTGEAS